MGHEFLALGSYNCCYWLKGLDSLVRFPLLCKSAFRYEKSADECQIMKYVSHFTSIPIPELLDSGSCDLGPYMVMSLVDGEQLSDLLMAPQEAEIQDQGPIVLRPDIDTALLFKAYRSMASVIIKLSKCRFSSIGAIGQDTSGDWAVSKRAITLNMNQVVSCGNCPRKELPQQAFATANTYFTALAETHLNHFQYQRNDPIDDEDDCRKKYVARHLFLEIARTFSKEHKSGPFPLYCDDLRPTNVIVDRDLNVQGVMDWEYCYAAPVEFTYCPPWWLLLTHPDDWQDGDMDDFLEQYMPRYRLYMEALRAEEDEMIAEGELVEHQRLSTKMGPSLDSGQFWFCLAATSSFGFDDIYWKFIDPLCYGKITSVEDRLRLLGPETHAELEEIVNLKMRQAEEEGLDEHDTAQEKMTA